MKPITIGLVLFFIPIGGFIAIMVYELLRLHREKRAARLRYRKFVDDEPTPRTDALIERLENFYAFECEAGPLKMCIEWQQLKRELAAKNAAPQEPVHGYSFPPPLGPDAVIEQQTEDMRHALELDRQAASRDQIIEECARVCDGICDRAADLLYSEAAKHCAEAIRTLKGLKR